MRYDDDRYNGEEDDNDLWDDELDLTADERPPLRDDEPLQDYTPHSPYPPYHPDDHNENPYDHNDDATIRDHEPEEPNDYYSDSADDPEPQPARRPKAPRLDPEDPDYWIGEEEPTLSGMIQKPVKKWKWQLAAVAGFLILIIGVWIWFFRLYSDNAVSYGYISHMERRGSIIKTFEGVMIPYKELGDPEPLYFRKVRFSVQGDSLAAAMKRMMLGCVPVRVEYETYHTPLPWKGEEKMVIIKADSADPGRILPPEYRFHN